MLPKQKRLNLKTSFRWVASGKTTNSAHFKIFYRLGENTEAKIGVSLVSAQFKKAVLRNAAKRICFKMAGESYSRLPKNMNLVIMPKAQILNADFQVLSKEYDDAISDLKTN